MNQTNLKKFLAECRVDVDRKLDAIVPRVEDEPRNLHAAIRWSLLGGGKRFRPALCLAVGESFEIEREKLLPTACALEMIHAYSLIHDDLPAMDDDDLRRGRLTCHKKFNEATAILAGDVLQTLAFQIVADDENLSPEIRIRLIQEIARAAGTPTGMVAGQMFDLNGEKQKVSAAELERIHRAKTGAMIVAAARCGALVGGANNSEINAISNYAAHIGLLFQITDDLLDVTATSEVLGKTPGKDVKAEKSTYLTVYGYERAAALAAETHREAVAALDELNKPIDLLRAVADYILHRNA